VCTSLSSSLLETDSKPYTYAANGSRCVISEVTRTRLFAVRITGTQVAWADTGQGFYDLGSPLSFDRLNQLYLVAHHDCHRPPPGPLSWYTLVVPVKNKKDELGSAPTIFRAGLSSFVPSLSKPLTSMDYPSGALYVRPLHEETSFSQPTAASARHP
jgi:hypothetical protein